MRSLLLSVLSCVTAASGLSAQSSPFASEWRPSVLSSGAHDNQSDRPQVVFQQLVRASQAPWVRLIVDEASLANGSYIEVVSVLDSHVHRIDAAELARWANRSAYMNGDMLLVRLVAGPRATGVSMKTSAIEAGVRQNHVDPASQCGPTDDRVPSTDKRTGRLLPSGCTAWLISNQNCFITAGHCRSSGQMTVQYNVPPSNSNGQINHPGPQDQYPVDTPTVVGTTGGIGNDWAVFKTRLNGTTRRHAGAVQGAFFKVGFVKPPVNRRMRITGYGVDRDQRTRNQTNQTHAGPLRTNSGTQLCYFLDTEGGNSGSPVIDDVSGEAVGVHTHGGCRTNGSGCNSGTSTTNTAFATAVRNLRCEPPFCNNSANFTAYGQACKSAKQACAVSFQQNWQQRLANQTTTATRIGILEFSRPRTNVCGIDLYTRSRSGNVDVTVSIMTLDPRTGLPGPVRSSAKVTVGTTAGVYSVKLNPYLVAENDLFVIAFDNADKLVLPTTSTGQTNTHYEYRNNAWGQLVFNTNFQYRVHNEGGQIPPVLSNTDLPILGKSFSIDLASAPANQPALLFIGGSRTTWGAIALPFDMTPIGAPGCNILASGTVVTTHATSAMGTVSVPLTLPREKSLCNLHLYSQYFILDMNANQLGFISSNAGDAHLGSQ